MNVEENLLTFSVYVLWSWISLIQTFDIEARTTFVVAIRKHETDDLFKSLNFFFLQQNFHFNIFYYILTPLGMLLELVMNANWISEK